jgi:hypothetical protein
MLPAADSWANQLELSFCKQKVTRLRKQDAYATSRTDTRTAAYVGLAEVQCTEHPKTNDAAPALSALQPTVTTYPVRRLAGSVSMGLAPGMVNSCPQGANAQRAERLCLSLDAPLGWPGQCS